MKLVGKVPVEPLEEERLTNIERNLVVHVSEMAQRPAARAPSRMLAFAAVAFAVLVAGFIGWKLRGADVVPATEPERIALMQGKLDLGDADIASSPNANATIERTPGRVVIVMKIGRLDLHVEHKPGRLFVVRAGDVEIEDVGTRFSVDYDGKNVDVRVTEGEVKVKRNGTVVAIKANEAWTLELGKTTIAVLAERAASHATSPQTTAQTTTQTTATNENVVAIAPTANANAGSGSGTTTHKGGATNARKAILGRTPQAPAIDLGGKPSVKSYIDYANEPGRTLDEKAWALYGSALLQHKTKHDKEALYTLSGLLRPDRKVNAYKPALWLQVRIRCLQAMDDKCREAASLYLQKFVSGPEAGIAQQILSEISQ